MTLVRFEADSLLEYAESQIVEIEYERSLREPPWDGKYLLHIGCKDTLEVHFYLRKFGKNYTRPVDCTSVVRHRLLRASEDM